MPDREMSQEMREHLEAEHGHVYHGDKFAGWRITAREDAPTVNDRRCRDCKWWGLGLKHGWNISVCHSPKLEGNIITLHKDELHTHADFGCVFWEGK